MNPIREPSPKNEKFLDISFMLPPQRAKISVDLDKEDLILHESFGELIAEREEKGLDYIIALIKETHSDGDAFFVYDALALKEWAAKKKINPMTNRPLGKIFWFTIQSSREKNFTPLGDSESEGLHRLFLENHLKASTQDPVALFLTALCYHMGIGTNYSKSNAERYFMLASKNGHFEASFFLNILDKEPNVQPLIELAEKGDAAALYNLGVCYLKGYGVCQSDEKAAKLFLESANLGYSCALYRLGSCHRDGCGVDQSLVKARSLWAQAAALHHPLAQKRLDEIEEQGCVIM